MTRIAYTIHSADILSLGYLPEEVRTYATRLFADLDADFPGAEVTVDVEHHVTGASPIRVESDEDEDRIRERVVDIANRVLEAL